MANVTLVTKDWLNQAQAELAGALEEPDDDDSPTALRQAKLISAAMIAKVFDSPCSKCVRAEQEGTPRRDCRRLGCDRWSTRRARRWMRRSQCPQQAGSPPCPARNGGKCPCQAGFQLSSSGQWVTTVHRLRDRVPDLADVLLVDVDEDA